MKEIKSKKKVCKYYRVFLPTIKGMTKRQLNSLRQKIKEEDFIHSIQMAGLENMEEMWDWICVQIGLDEDGKDVIETIKAFIGLKLLEQRRAIIQGILDDTVNTNEDVWTGSEIREYLEKELKNEP